MVPRSTAALSAALLTPSSCAARIQRQELERERRVRSDTAEFAGCEPEAVTIIKRDCRDVELDCFTYIGRCDENNKVTFRRPPGGGLWTTEYATYQRID